MAELLSDTGALRLALDLVDREAPVRGPSAAVAGDGAPPSGRFLVSVGLEYLDGRDRQFWPLVRLAALYLTPGVVDSLAAGIADLAQGTVPGLAWQAQTSGTESAFGLQIGTEGAPPGKLLVEAGFDLGLFLADAAQMPHRPGAELALFRFLAEQASLVRFGGALASERAALEEA